MGELRQHKTQKHKSHRPVDEALTSVPPTLATLTAEVLVSVTAFSLVHVLGTMGWHFS